MAFEYVCIAVVACFWGSYPLVSRSSGYGAPLGTLVLAAAGLVPILLATLYQGGAERPSTAAVARLTIAGAMMGTGLTAFNWVANSKLDASVAIPIINTAMLIITTIGAVYFFGEAMTARKLVGLALLLAGITALRSS